MNYDNEELDMNKNSLKKKVLIFDLDGTLFDTKQINFISYQTALSDMRIDSKLDYEYYCKNCNGNDYREFLPVICSEITSEQLELVHKRKIANYKNNLALARKNELLFSVASMSKAEFYISIATTASKKNTIDILQYFSVLDLFDFIVTKEDVKNTKPDPECYKKVIEHFNLQPQDALIFEDSDIGIEAAKRSGASYIKVYGYN